ncbi:hypothetical protein [Leifsonia sp. Leaf264]|uniref:hypothetical protein n=1 Tax=Leifsonia sp. Leaf264 TaxID=1736314 RepID=UPI000700C928|nr:hypothetical protein [Leifsonia sp. Leaf264]KQO98358.1 hypothetical protein ASF30_09875 [Leifsonia sp. Leaf264]
MNTARITGATLLAAAAITALAACSTPAPGNSWADFTMKPAATAEATPTPTLVPGDKNGDGRLSEFEKQVLAQDAPKDYALADGTVMTVDPAQPLPDSVKADIVSGAAPAVDVFNADAGEGVEAVREYLNTKADQAGRGVVAVIHVYSNSDGMVWGVLASNTKATITKATPDQASALVAAEAWAAAKGYDVVVID